MGCPAYLLGNALGLGAASLVVSWLDGSEWWFVVAIPVYVVGYFVPFYLFAWLFPNFEV